MRNIDWNDNNSHSCLLLGRSRFFCVRRAIFYILEEDLFRPPSVREYGVLRDVAVLVEFH